MNEYLETGRQFWRIFTHYLLVNSTEEPTYLLTRQHFGSYAASALAGYNTYLLRQKIIKNAISLTKSTRPPVVRAASMIVAGFYFCGLCVMWHIPSFFAELAVRVYCSSENAATTILFREYLRRQVFSEQRLSYILRECH